MPRLVLLAAALISIACDSTTRDSTDPEELNRLDRIDQPDEDQYAGNELDEAEAWAERSKFERADGSIKKGENMGDRFIHLDEIVVPVTRDKEYSRVHTLEIRLARSPDSDVSFMLMPRAVQSSEGWKYLECHSIGLYVGEDWSVGGAKGSDGSWLKFDSTHEGSVPSSGSSRLIEIVGFRVEGTVLREWASAAVAGGQICFDKFEFSASQKARVLEFLDTPFDGVQPSDEPSPFDEVSP